MIIEYCTSEIIFNVKFAFIELLRRYYLFASEEHNNKIRMSSWHHLQDVKSKNNTDKKNFGLTYRMDQSS